MRAISILENDNYYNTLMLAVMSAKKSIYISMFSYNMLDNLDKNMAVRNLTKLLIQKKQEGVDVRIIFGNAYKHDHSRFIQLLDGSNEMAFTFLKAFGVQAGFFQHHTYQSSHSKYVVIDKEHVFIGSHNFSPRSFSIGLDDSVKVVDSRLGSQLTSLFLADWKFAYIPKNAETTDFDASVILFPKLTIRSPRVPTVQDDFTTKLLVNEKYFDTLISGLNQAKQSIRISMFYFSYHKDAHSITSKIVTALAKAIKNKVQVQVILDRDNPSDIYSSHKANKKRFDELKKLGVDIKFDKKEVASHGKLCIIDQEKVIIGSHNWTQGSYQNYEETSILIESKKLATLYNRIFTTRFSTLA